MSEVLITSSVLILAVFILRFLLRGTISRRLQYALWGLVALRLLIPVSLPSSLSVMNAVEKTPIQAVSQQVLWFSPDVTLAASQQPSFREEAKAPSPQEDPLPVLPLVWAAGALVVAGTLIGVNCRFAVKLRRDRKRVDIDWIPLPVYLTRGISSPCLFGLFRPAIYLTPGVMKEEESLRHVLIHEYSHYRHWDTLWSVVRGLCLALYWFSPLVWAAAVCSKTDCELACDELAVKTLGEEQRFAYGRTLVGLVDRNSSFTSLANLATTMSMSASGIRRRVALIAKSPKTAAPVLLGVVFIVVALASCTFTSSKMTASQAAEWVEQGISYQQGTLEFTLPQAYPEGEDWNILVYGTAQMDEGEMSVHLFEENNIDRSWEPGQAYTIDLNQQAYTELKMELYCYSDPSVHITVDLLEIAGGGPIVQAAEYTTVFLTFPAYQTGRTQENAWIYDTPAFDLELPLPEGWYLDFPPVSQREGQRLWTPVDLYDQEGKIGSIGFNRYEKYQGEDVPLEEYYKTVFYELRLSSFENWDPYTPVVLQEGKGSGIAQVTYHDPQYLSEHPGEDLASVPQLETMGVLCYDDSLEVYVGIRLEEDAQVDEETLRFLAEGMSLHPSEYGMSGKRYTGPYADRDYSGISILDAQGNDVTSVMIDLWYCASDAYDVDGMFVFENGDWAVLSDNEPQYVELVDYDQVMPRLFTASGISQYESSDVVRIHRTQEGKVYRLGPWSTGYFYGPALRDMKAVEVQEGKILLEVTFEKNTGGINREEDPDYVPQYGTVPFTVVEEDGVWLIDSYTYPGDV